ncbi:MAG: transcription termination/antitermination protein NusA [Methanothermococcus sp.]|uniref:NusA-like transcription termination signal-binding factor n=1 Tax=Methanothermococcus sp. TaxID=2614238 RepID=UPI0025857E99|nr:NusA-like transcription termination signal-binding factor [Methanothermococcus sp.]MDK2789809.1 transcription termination/antitermination protein NusA [Methanothermococcus sp.]MDK2987233.1 transcription termination/antitermination protein NusA [Methanothermococcus sp.]
MKVKLNTDDIMKISFFEKMTGAHVMDSISDDEKIVFVVKEGDIGAAIGKGGENVRNAMEKFGKKIDLIEYSDDLKQFVRNIFAPAKLEDVWIKKFGDDLVVYIRIHPKLRKSMIGDKGKNIDRAVSIASRLAGVKNIKVVAGLRKDSRDERRPARTPSKEEAPEQPKTETKEQTPEENVKNEQ